MLQTPSQKFRDLPGQTGGERSAYSPREVKTVPSENFMNWITTAARIAILLTIGLMFAKPLAAHGTNRR
jgi:hypothetical protein